MKIKVLTWHVHGSYLYYLSQCNCDFYLPVKADDSPGYGGRAGSFKWGNNVIEVEANEVKKLRDIDVILFQSKDNYLKDQFEILNERQRLLPKIYLEHDPPREHPTDTKHVVNDPNSLLINVTHFNDLMWDSQATPSKVVDHGVIIPKNVVYSGELNKGIVVVNNLAKRGRRLGWDIFKEVRKEIPLDLIGMGSEEIGGLGEVPHDEIGEFISKYRFFFNPIRYTSLGLAVLEAMTVGLPILGLATTEMVTAIKNGVNGYIDTDINILVKRMRQLLTNPEKAKKLSAGAKRMADKRFGIKRFVAEWEGILSQTAARISYSKMQGILFKSTEVFKE
ncbi:MAG: glycosyltransferase family 4 protein [Patescibacteria group bacterium]|jgi:glycosyltransferase involved in cell wall biosynthesis